MKRSCFPSALMMLASLIVLTSGCQSYKPRQQLIPAEVSTTAPTQGRPTLGQPIKLPDCDVFVVPFTLDRPKQWLEDSDRFDRDASASMAKSGAYDAGESFGSIGLTQSVRWHNAVIQKNGGKGQLVLDRRGMISRFEVVGPWIEIKKETDPNKTQMKFVPKGMLILATVQDTNGDEQLTSQDASILYAADAQGQGLHPITPAGKQVLSTRYNAELNLVLIMIASDTNGDGLFTEADSAAPYLYVPGDTGPAKPLVNPGLQEQAEGLLK